MCNVFVDAINSFWNQMRNKIAWSTQGSQTHEKVTVQGIKGSNEAKHEPYVLDDCKLNEI